MEYIENSKKTEVYKDKLSYLFIKRVIDICGGLVGSLIAIILIIVVKIVSLANGDTYPIVFTQVRIGLNGKPITIYKLRSMIPNADEVLFKLMEEDPAIREEYTVNKKLKNDPRVTKIGKFIRAKSLDEFPQFFNVLIGNMSLVGPRPYLPREKVDMGEAYDEIIKVKPGITGPWQTGGRSNTDFVTRLSFDIGYVEHHDIKSDIMMIIHTVHGGSGGAI